ELALERSALNRWITVLAGIHQPALQVEARNLHRKRRAAVEADREAVVLLLQSLLELVAHADVQRHRRGRAKLVLRKAGVIVLEEVPGAGHCDVAGCWIPQQKAREGVAGGRTGRIRVRSLGEIGREPEVPGGIAKRGGVCGRWAVFGRGLLRGVVGG